MTGRRRGRIAWATAALALVAAVPAAAAPTPDPGDVGAEPATVGLERAVVSPPPIQFDVPTAGPLGSVSIIGDSVLYGSGRYSPTLSERLVQQGWGPVRFRAGAGYSTGFFGRSFELTTTHWIRLWREQGWEADNVIVNVGANDTEFCATDVECSYRAIMHVVDEIGPGPRIWWPKITKFFTHTAQANAWNAALDRVAGERDDFDTWDWPTELATGGYESNDNTHLVPSSYPLRSLRMAEAFTARLGRARRVASTVDLSVPLGEPSTYRSIDARRLVDTRADPSMRQTIDTTLRLDLTDEVPAATTAVALYVAAAAQSGPGFVTVAPCHASSDGAALTFVGTPVGAPTIVAVDDDAPTVCLEIGGVPGTEADLVVDLQGAFVAGTDHLRLHPLDVPTRLADTRGTSAGGVDTVVVDAPDTAHAVVLNLAVANADEHGFVAAHPCGQEADTANLNFAPGAPASASAIVAVGDSGSVCVTPSTSADIVVDITASFADATARTPNARSGSEADGGLAFVPIVPMRLLDTRDGTGGWAPVHGANQTLDIAGGPGWAEAVSGTLTMVGPRETGFLQATACGAPPAVASANAGPHATVSNALTTGLDAAGRLCVRSSTLTNTVFDATGWWADAAAVA